MSAIGSLGGLNFPHAPLTPLPGTNEGPKDARRESSLVKAVDRPARSGDRFDGGRGGGTGDSPRDTQLDRRA